MSQAKLKFSTVLYLSKLAEALETPASSNITSHFPFLEQQQTWKYKHDKNKLVFQNGEAHFGFTLPEDFVFDHEKFPNFQVERTPTEGSLEFSKLEAPEKTVQVHRAHPGEIYFTLQEGKKNPTLRFIHESGAKWRGILKKPVAKKIQDMAKELNLTEEVEKTSYVARAVKSSHLLSLRS